MAKRTIAPESRSAQEKSSYTRKLKVRKGSYDYQINNTLSIHTYKVPSPVPWIHVKGYWLNKAGFTIGTEVCMEVSDGCLVIRAIPGTSPVQRDFKRSKVDVTPKKIEWL